MRKVYGGMDIYGETSLHMILEDKIVNGGIYLLARGLFTRTSRGTIKVGQLLE